MIPVKFHVFQDGEVPAGKITAERLNKNWDALYDMFDPTKVGISEDNIAPTSKILVSDRDYIISGSFSFTTPPVFTAGAIPESAIDVENFVVKENGVIKDEDLPTNLARKDANETITGSWEFSSVAGVIKEVTSLPAEVTPGMILRYNGDLYLGTASAWVRLVREDTLLGYALTPSTAERNNNTTSQNTTSSSFVLLKETEINEEIGGELNLVVSAYVSGGAGEIYFAKNSSMLGSEITVTEIEPVDKALNNVSISLQAGDKLQVFGRKLSGGTLYVSDFRLHFDIGISSFLNVGLKNLLVLATASQRDLDATYNL